MNDVAEVSVLVTPTARYSNVAVVLHWLTATAFAVQLGLGWRMDGPHGPQTFAVFQLHKSIGITILVLTAVRIAWRLLKPPPPMPVRMDRQEKILAHAVHGVAYVLLLGLPLSGWLIVSSSSIAVPTLLYGIVPWPHMPGVTTLTSSARHGLNGAAGTAHLAAGWIALLAIALHLAGALKHQFVDRSGDFARMLPAPRRALATTVLCIVAAFGLLIAAGRSVRLSPTARAGVAASSTANSSVIAARAAPVPSTVPPATSSPLPPESVPKPADWSVRAKDSRIRFHTSWSQGSVDGGFAKWRAVIQFDPQALNTAAATVTIDMASVSVADSDQQSALPESDWFAVAAHPTATWRATRFRRTGRNAYAADGLLTLRGVTRPVTMPFSVTIAGDVATMSAKLTVDRTLFGVGQGEWTSTADLPALVTVSIAITADRISE